MMCKKGFTLIELLIVLAVISTLLGAFIPAASNAVERAKGIQVAFNLTSIMRGIDYHLLLHGELPDSLHDITRNLDPDQYGVIAAREASELTIVVFTRQLAQESVLKEVLPEAIASLDLPEDLLFIEDGLKELEDATFFYRAYHSL